MALHLFLVKFNECSYDQYDGFVVAAESADAAVKVIRAERWQEPYGGGKRPLDIDWDGGYTVELVEPSEPMVVLSSNRGG